MTTGSFQLHLARTIEFSLLAVLIVQLSSGMSNGVNTISDSCNRTSSIGFSPDGDKIVTSGSDSMVKLWDIKSQKCLKTFTGHKKWIWSVAFSPNGKTIASGSDDFSVKLWSIERDNCLKTFSGHTDCIWAVKFSPNGKMLASGSYDRSIKLWDIDSGQCLQTLLGHSNWVCSVAFSPNGETIASGGQDGTIKFWDVKTGQYLKTLQSPKPYEGTNIKRATGLTLGEQTTLKLLGAVEN